MNVQELTGMALDWAVAKADSHRVAVQSGHLYLVDEKQRRIAEWKPSSAWAQGGPIIERENIQLMNDPMCSRAKWQANVRRSPFCTGYGPTPLIAAMRCFVASKMSLDIELPEELK